MSSAATLFRHLNGALYSPRDANIQDVAKFAAMFYNDKIQAKHIAIHTGIIFRLYCFW